MVSLLKSLTYFIKQVGTVSFRKSYPNVARINLMFFPACKVLSCYSVHMSGELKGGLTEHTLGLPLGGLCLASHSKSTGLTKGFTDFLLICRHVQYEHFVTWKIC